MGVGRYGVRIPSVTVVSTYSGDRIGTSVGLGVRWNLVPDTLVTPAASLDLSAIRSQYPLSDWTQTGLGGQVVDLQLTLEQLQVAVVFSKRVGLWEPYGGVKWLQTFVRLKDLSTSQHVGGTKNAVIPFAGVRYQAFAKEALVAEASFTNGFQFGGGIEIRFR